MEQVARIKFGEDLVLPQKSAVVQIVENEGEHTLLIAIPLKATTPTGRGVNEIERDAYVWPKNLVSPRHLKIQIKSNGVNEPFSKLSIEADFETKVPETGAFTPKF